MRTPPSVRRPLDALTLSLLLGCLVTPAQADEATSAPSTPTTAITFSLTTPLVKVYELGWEQYWGHGLSTVVMVGGGEVSMDTDGQAPTDGTWLFETGLQLRLMFAGEFDDGVGFAAVGRFLWASALSDGTEPRGSAFGPHLFWRTCIFYGLTVDLYLGGSFQAAILRNPASGEERKRDRIVPTGGLSIGWSFAP